MHAAQSPLRTDCGTFSHAFALLLAVSKMPLRHPVCGRITYPLGLESCWGFPVSHACRTEPFAGRLWHILARFALLLAVSKMPLRHPVCGRITYHLGLNPAGVSPVSHACRTEPFADRLWHILARFALLLAVSKMPLRHPVCGRITYHLGLNPAGGFPVSHACRTEPFADRLWHIFARFCFAFSGFEDAASAPSLRTNYLPPWA